MSRILVTGGCGFIGSHLVERLVADGHAVTVVDNYATGDAGHLAGVIDKLDALINEPVTEALDSIVSDDGIAEDFAVIYHLAGHVGVGHILADPLLMLTDHAADIAAVVDLAERHNAVLVVASSSEVYGDSEDVPYREDAVLHVGPSHELRSGYAVSKLYVEHYALAAHRMNGCKAIVTRLFNVAGPRQRAEGGCVVPRFVTAALSGQPLELHGNGMAFRCFSHVEDVVTALVRLAETPEAIGKVVNVGHGTPITIRQAARDIVMHVAEIYDVSSSLRAVHFDQTDPDAGWSRMLRRVPDVTRLTHLTGYVIPPRWPDIVRDTCAYWAQRLGMTQAKSLERVVHVAR